MLKFQNCVNLIEILKNGEKVLMQYPDQIKKLKELLINYNNGYLDYDGIDQLIIDAGAGGGGVSISQELMNEWKDQEGKTHRGFIDLNDEYMKLREDDFIGNADNLKMFNFKRDKATAYQNLQDAINQGLIIFPKDLNTRAEIEFEEVDANGNLQIRYEKASTEELNTLTQFSLMKDEIVGMNKIKKPNGTIVFETSPEGKQRGLHDDRADIAAMCAFRLMELRASEALDKAKPPTEINKIFSGMGHKRQYNPFASKKTNPFNTGFNPFN